jgi:monoamine oxidase
LLFPDKALVFAEGAEMNPFNTNFLSRRSVLTSLLAAATVPAWAQTIPTNPDVVIIGAGSAGLSAARTLIARGKSVVIVEGANRIGGRAYTESDTFGVPYDHGCFNVMGPKNFAYKDMAKEWGFDLLYMKGAGENVFVGDRKATSSELGHYDVAWGTMRSALNKAGRAGLDVSAASAMPDNFGDMMFAGLSQTWMGPMDFSVDFEDLSVQDWWQYGEVPSNYMIKQGYGTLVARMGENLPVKLNTPATRVDWGGDGVTVETPAGAIRAKACIVTVSTGVLTAGSIKFTPELPDWKQQAIGNLPMGLLAKVTLQFDGERFGLRKNKWLSYVVPNDMPAEACYFLTWPFDFDIMIGWVGGQFGWELTGAGTDAAVDFALEEVVKMLGSDARKHFVKGHLTGWGENPWVLGAYAAAIPSHYGARAELAKPLADRLFFAGEAVAAPYMMLCSGAYKSGEAVANDVAAII